MRGLAASQNCGFPLPVCVHPPDIKLEGLQDPHLGGGPEGQGAAWGEEQP
jgi:hypothetical protein